MRIDKKKMFSIQAKKKMSNTKLAELTGLSGNRISIALRGLANCTPVTIGKICEALEVEPEDILVKEDE